LLVYAHAWVYEITPVRHVFVISYAARYIGDEQPHDSREHKEFGRFEPTQISGLTMAAPYETSITKALGVGSRRTCHCPMA
jgi:hypothetical protein